MARDLCRFTISGKKTRPVIEYAVAEAIFAAECIHGPARVRLGARYYLSEERSQVILDASTQVGEHMAQLVAGILTRRVGENGYRVERLDAEVMA